MVEAEGNKKPVFYIYDEAMMQHKDHNYQNEEGKATTTLPEPNKHDFVSPEVPFRIKAIYEHLRAEPASAPLLAQMVQLEIENAEGSAWEGNVLRVHPISHIDKIRGASDRLEDGETSYDLNEDNYECSKTFASAKLSS